MMQVSKKIPFDDPNVLNAIRAVYVLSNIIIAGIYLYVQQKVNGKKGAFPGPLMHTLADKASGLTLAP